MPELTPLTYTPQSIQKGTTHPHAGPTLIVRTKHEFPLQLTYLMICAGLVLTLGCGSILLISHFS